jgi:hypothetical protein
LYPSELADVTLTRVAKKLATVEIRDIARFALGVGRYVFLEERPWDSPEIPIDDLPGGPESLADPGDQERAILESIDNSLRLACLRECLAMLKRGDSLLAIAYYSAEQKAQSEHRRRLAEKAGKTKDTLMTYMNRIRARLELCVNSRLDVRRKKIRAIWESQQRVLR